MKATLLAALAASISGGTLQAQPVPAPEPLSAWRYFKEIQVPRVSTDLLDLVLDREALSNARTDQADLRLYNAAGREIPYLLRVRRDVVTSSALPAREFNRSADRAASQLTLDLGEQPQQHNQVDV